MKSIFVAVTMAWCHIMANIPFIRSVAYRNILQLQSAYDKTLLEILVDYIKINANFDKRQM